MCRTVQRLLDQLDPQKPDANSSMGVLMTAAEEAVPRPVPPAQQAAPPSLLRLSVPPPIHHRTLRIGDVSLTANRQASQRNRSQEHDQRPEAGEVRQLQRRPLGIGHRHRGRRRRSPTPANARPTTNHAPARTASHPPSIAVARLREKSSSRPPITVAIPGSTSSQARAVVHVHAWSGVKAKSKDGPTNGINAPQAPKRISRNPLAAPRLRGIRILPLRGRTSVSTLVMLPPLSCHWVPKRCRGVTR